MKKRRQKSATTTKIRECVTISRGTASRGKTVVGSHNLIMAYVHIAHDDVVGSHCVMANRVSLAGEVEVGDWAVIGGHVAVHQWTRIGEHTMIQGGALVGKDIPPFITVSNNDPVRFACVNRVGLSRRGFTPETISQIHDACRILFQSGLNYLNGCEEVEKTDSAKSRTRPTHPVHPRIAARHYQALLSEQRKRRIIFRHKGLKIGKHSLYL